MYVKCNVNLRKLLSAHKSYVRETCLLDGDTSIQAYYFMCFDSDNHVPLSLARHTRLLKIRRKLVLMIHNSAILIAALKGSCAISQTDAEDLGADRLPNYKKNFLLINVILRRSDYSFECLHQALGSTHQQDAADYLIEGKLNVFLL